MTRPRISLLLAAGIAASVSPAGAARANPRPLPFTYQSETLPTGSVELEQFVDFLPLRGQTAAGDDVSVLATQFITEFEIGLTDRLELGLYVTLAPSLADGFFMAPRPLEGNGAKQRLRWRLADPEAWPVDVALYGEVAENEREVELEAKVILQRRVGRLRLITNLWAEHEFYFDGRREWVLNPTLGGTVELTPRYHVGVESWMRAEYPVGASGPRPYDLGPHVYAGPAFLAAIGRLWWSTGVYLRVTDLERPVAVGDQFGRFWVRTIIGVGF
jgi:hypothetical protein